MDWDIEFVFLDFPNYSTKSTQNVTKISTTDSLRSFPALVRNKKTL